MNIILYTAGSHGRYLKFLFDCYTHGKILEANFNINGNSHNHDLTNNGDKNILAFDVCHNDQFQAWQKISKEEKDVSVILWQGLEEFYYIMQAYTMRGGSLKENGITLLEKDLSAYEDMYGTKVYISEILKKHFNFDCKKLGQPPRGLLRNYFLSSFFTYFENTCWIKNNKLSNLSNQNYKIINLKELLDYNLLEQFLHKIFNKKLNFQDVHKTFLDKNNALKQLYKVKEILNAIDRNENMEIVDLNVISEAYILFVLECKYFDIPFLLGDSFYRNTKEFCNYIKYFPNNMKKPNNLFHTYHNHFKRQDKTE